MQTKTIKDVLGKSFRQQGFKVPARGRIFFELDSDFLVWVGCSLHLRHDTCEVSVSVGLHHVEVMRLVDQLKGRNYIKGNIATYAASLGSISECESCELLRLAQDLEPQADKLVASVVSCGMPWARSVASLETLIGLLKGRETLLGELPERIAVSLLLAGRLSELTEYVKSRQLSYEIDGSNPHLAESWREFSRSLEIKSLGFKGSFAERTKRF